jgi:hypothetical protein
MRIKEIIRNPNFSFLLFFLFLFFYYLLVFDPSLYYHYHQPIFFFDKTYLKEFLLYPGGAVELITQFFLQFFYFNLFGAFFVSALSSSVFIIIYKFIKKIGGFKYSLILSFLPVFSLLIIQNHYNYPLILTVKYLFALILFLVYVKTPERYKAFLIPLSCLVYYILGGGIYLFYIVLCVLHELLFREDSKKYIYAGLNVVVYLIYSYIAARYLFIITLKEAYLYIAPHRFYIWPFNFNPSLYFYLFFLFFPALQIALFVYLRYTKVKVKKQNKLLAGFHSISAQSILIILAAVLLLTFSFDWQEKKKIQIDYLAEQGRWNELLSISREIDKYNFRVFFNVNRALYHTGQLLDNLFTYPQLIGSNGLFIDKISARQAAVSISDLYFDLGHIKAAQVMAYEGQTKFKNNPRILKRIVITNIINEKYGVAKKFLDLLDKSILHKKWVRHYRKYLFNDSLIKSDRLIQLKRKQTPKSDFFITTGDPEVDLMGLLIEKGNNKMAFEYLMAYYLLEYRLKDLAKHLDKFKKLGYRKYPRHIKEASLLIRAIYPSKNIAFAYSINQQTIKQFDQFNRILSKFGNKEKAKEILKKGFYNTYWYYVLYIKPNRTEAE